LDKKITKLLILPVVLLIFVVSVLFLIDFKITEALALSDLDNDYSVLDTKIYNLDDNTGYYPNDNFQNKPFNKSYANISIHTLTKDGTVLRNGSMNGVPAYGINAGQEVSEDGNIISIDLKYNYQEKNKINNTQWNISSDTAKSVSGMTVGEIKSGALLVQKSKNGKDWKWANSVNGGESTNLHTTDFINLYSPTEYFDNTKSIYIPAGADIAEGVYIKVLFAYELSYEKEWQEEERTWYTFGIGTKTVTKREWQYRNILEETVFYLASDSAEVAFTNESDDKEATDDGTSEIVQMAGTIRDGHCTLYGFRLNKLGNQTFDVKYRLNNSDWNTAEDGQYFGEMGRFDFQVTTIFGKVKYYSIFVDYRDVNSAIFDYFGKNFITEDSKRIFSTVDDVPVYVAGQTYYNINPVDEFKMPIAGKITNLDTQKSYSIDATRKGKKGIIDVPGKYEAEFYTNKDYYGEMSGDAFHFVFKFNVIDKEEIPNPMINQELLNGLTGFSNFNSAYYGVSLPSKGNGNIIYAFADYASAFDFAYVYELGLVKSIEDGFVYKDIDNQLNQKTYASQFEVLEAVTKIAEQKVAKRYFDATNPDSYITLEEYTADILSLDLNFDIVVISDDSNLELLRAGEPFLNGSVYRCLSADGSIKEGINEVQFIKIADFESDTIRMKHIDSDTLFSISYRVSVSQQLEALNAPSGRYEITETTKDGDKSVYYAVYIKKGEVTTNLTVSIFDGTNLVTDIYSQKDNELRQRVSGFILRSAENKYDPYSIVKIVKDNDNTNPTIYELSEIENIPFDQDGVYRVYLIDRLGNFCSFVFDVIDATKAINIEFESADKEITSDVAFIGQTFELPIPNVENEYYEFVGWEYKNALISENHYVFTVNEDVKLKERLEKTYVLLTFNANGGSAVESLKIAVGEEIELPFSAKKGFVLSGWKTANGEKYSGTYKVENSDDIAFTAVWHYPSTVLSLYDGDLYQTINTKPDEKLVLPTLTKDGYTLFGWMFSEQGSNGIFYIGQITTVPNVPSLRLDAVWTKSSGEINIPDGSDNKCAITLVDGGIYDTITAEVGQKVELPELTANGMEFFGWMYQRETLAGTIYRNGQIPSVPNLSQIMLQAVWKTAASNVATNARQLSLGKAGTILTPFEVEQINEFNYKTMFGMLLGWLGLVILAVFVNVLNAMMQPETGRNSAFRKKVVPIISLILVVATFGLLFVGWPSVNRDNFALTNQHNNIGTTANDEFTKSDYINSISTVKPQISLGNSGAYDLHFRAGKNNDNTIVSEKHPQLDFTDEELFLYARVLTDLMQLGYDAFPAYVNNLKGERIYGIAYTEHIDVFKSKNINDTNIYYASGFAKYQGQSAQLTDDDMDEGLIITPLNLICEGFGYLLTFTYNMEDYHYIAYDKYITYGISQYDIHYTSQENCEENYNYDLGLLYSYDLERTVYDPNIGVGTDIIGANGLNVAMDYDAAAASFAGYIEEQNANGLAVDTAHITYISRAALNEYMLTKQAETFLGVDVEEIYLFESQLSTTEYYAVMPDGTLQKFELPPDPAPTKASWLDRLCGALVGALFVAVGVIIGAVVTVATCGALSTVGSVISGALIGAGIEVFMQTAIQGNTLSEVNWLKVGVAAVSGGLCAIPGVGWFGAALIGGATNAAMTAIDGGSLEDCLKSFAIGVATGVIIHGATKLLSKASSAVANKLGRCFVAGTGVLVLIDGVLVAKNIEDIKVGDLVASRNEITGAVEYKEVTQLFQSEHNEVIKVGRSDGQVITSSVDHPYYVINRGYVEAQNLRAGDKLLTVNGEAVVVEYVQHEILETPQILYNFEVDGNNNYYVAQGSGSEIGSFGLVHNACTATLRRRAVKEAWRQERELVKAGGGSREWSTEQIDELLTKGKVKGFEGHHINNVQNYPDMAGNPNNIEFLTREEHLSAHNGNWKNETHGDLIDRIKLLAELIFK